LAGGTKIHVVVDGGVCGATGVLHLHAVTSFIFYEALPAGLRLASCREKKADYGQHFNR
jgi:hypothetical protein